MDMRKYFEGHHGFGVLCTADSEGRVNAAVYARPHCFEDGTVGFVMPDRLTHRFYTIIVHVDQVQEGNTRYG